MYSLFDSFRAYIILIISCMYKNEISLVVIAVLFLMGTIRSYSLSSSHMQLLKGGQEARRQWGQEIAATTPSPVRNHCSPYNNTLMSHKNICSIAVDFVKS